MSNLFQISFWNRTLVSSAGTLVQCIAARSSKNEAYGGNPSSSRLKDILFVEQGKWVLYASIQNDVRVYTQAVHSRNIAAFLLRGSEWKLGLDDCIHRWITAKCMLKNDN